MVPDHFLVTLRKLEGLRGWDQDVGIWTNGFRDWNLERSILDPGSDRRW